MAGQEGCARRAGRQGRGVWRGTGAAGRHEEGAGRRVRTADSIEPPRAAGNLEDFVRSKGEGSMVMKKTADGTMELTVDDVVGPQQQLGVEGAAGQGAS